MTSGRVSFRERSAVACGKSALILLKISFCHSIVDQAWQARGSNTGHLWSKHFHRKFTRLSWEKRRYRAATCDADSLRLLATAEPELVYSCETSFEYLHAGFNCWASHEKPVILSKIMVRMALNPYITEKKKKTEFRSKTASGGSCRPSYGVCVEDGRLSLGQGLSTRSGLAALMKQALRRRRVRITTTPARTTASVYFPLTACLRTRMYVATKARTKQW